jgi:RNA polymerase sigma-B factor
MSDSDAIRCAPSVRAQLAVTANYQISRENSLFRQFAGSGDPVLRDRLFHNYERLAHYVASKFAGRGEPFEDLLQVACIGLIKAIDRFDLSLEFKFATYATATMVGEIQRHFRDTTHRMKTTRGMQELSQSAAKVNISLYARFGRAPTVAEVAKEIGATEEATLEAIEMNTYPAQIPEDSCLDELAGAEDPRIEAIVNNDELNNALKSLKAQEYKVVFDYYYNELSEAQIAKRMGFSQMHVSRLKKRAVLNLEQNMSKARRIEREYISKGANSSEPQLV